MHPFTIEQLVNQHGRDLRARATQKALVSSYKGASGRTSHLVSRLGARLRRRRGLAPVLVLAPHRRAPKLVAPYPHGLQVAKRTDALCRQLPTVARGLDTAEG